MSSLRLSFLGPPLIELNGKPVRIPRRKSVALLAYLAVTSRPQRRESLTDLLHAPGTRKAAPANFRNTLSALRTAIGSAWLRTDGANLQLVSRTGIWTDIGEFHRLIAAAEAAAADGDAAGCREGMAAAVALMRGPLLAGFSLGGSPDFDDWLVEEQENLRREHLHALERLVEISCSLGQEEAALAHARVWLSLERLDEAACRQVMRLAARLGRRSEALRTYERCREDLKRELGVEPSDETRALRRDIEQGKLQAAGTGETSPRRRGEISSRQRPPGNLPRARTAFIGRQRELAGLLESLGSPDARLLSVTGTCGTGKTTLALEAAGRAASRFADGVFLVDFSSAGGASCAMSLVATALRIPDAPSGAVEPLSRLRAWLRRRTVLLVLDSFERVIAAASEVAGLLDTCPRLVVLATSTEPLRVGGERELRLPPLSLPGVNEGLETIRSSEAVQLFEQRARQVLPGFSVGADNAGTVAEVCRRVDGLALAIELAAARLRMLPLASLPALLDKRLDLLRSGPRDLPPRQRALRDEIAWSFDLLSEAEKQVLLRIAAFDAGCTLEMAQTACGGGAENLSRDCVDGISSLVAKGMVDEIETPAGLRFALLPTIREFALERLRGAGSEAVAEEAAAWAVLTLAEQAHPRRVGPEEELWRKRLAAERANIVQALRWYLQSGRPEGVRIAFILDDVVSITERRELRERCRERFKESASKRDLAELLMSLGQDRYDTGMSEWPREEVRECFEEALQAARESGDIRLIALAQIWVGWCWRHADPPVDHLGLRQDALRLLSQIHDPVTLATCLYLTHVGPSEPDVAVKLAAMGKAQAYARKAGSARLLHEAIAATGRMLFWAGRPAEAVPWLQRAVGFFGDHDFYRHAAVSDLANTFQTLGRAHDAIPLYLELLEIAEELDWPFGMSGVLRSLGEIAAQKGNPRRAVRLAAVGCALACRGPAGPDGSGLPWLKTIDPAIVNEEWPAGAAMSVDEALSYARSEV